MERTLTTEVLTPLTLLYIAGLSHSGSTLTSRLLHEHSDIFTAGEFFHLHTVFNDDRDEEIVCRCNDIDPRDCEFWQEPLTELQEFCPDVEKMSCVDPYPPKEWVKSITGHYPRVDGKTFAEINQRFFDIIREKTGQSIIVDTSKTIWRLLPLFREMGNDIKVLHVIKKPENQVGSRYKRGMDSFFKSAIMKYGRRNFLYDFFCNDDNRYRKIRFEELAREFEPTLRSIHEWLGLEYEDPLEGPETPWHHLGGSEVVLTRPDIDRIKKDYEYNPLERLVLGGLETLY